MTYEVRIQQFSGPLDLLLHLIERAEIDIKDIFVSEITAQYLSYMDSLDDLDMDTASEFLQMAATLLYIKSRQLLPRPFTDDEEEEDPEKALIRQLREYKEIKKASENLEELMLRAHDMRTRLPADVQIAEKEVELHGVTLDGLYEAFLRVLGSADERNTPQRTHEVRPDTFTVRAQLQKIRAALLEHDRISFDELFSTHAQKLEMIVTFMALLEMIAHGEIMLRQKSPFSPIRISAKALLEDDTEVDYMDEYEE